MLGSKGGKSNSASFNLDVAIFFQFLYRDLGCIIHLTFVINGKRMTKEQLIKMSLLLLFLIWLLNKY